MYTPDDSQPSSTTPSAPSAQPVAPDVPQQTAAAVSMPVAQAPQPAAPAAPPPAAGTPSVWKQVALGALVGLSGGGGRSFGEGVGRGASAVLQYHQQQTENANTQAGLQMASMKAADDHVKALNESRYADQLSENAKVEYKQASANYQDFLQEHFGIEPDLTFNDSHTDAIAAMQTSAQRSPDGKVPPVVTVHQPEPQGTHGQIAAYSPSQQAMQQNSQGFLKLANTGRAAQGLPDFDSQTWNSLGFQKQRDAAQDALAHLKPTVPFSLDKSKGDYLPIVLSQRQQQLQMYQSHKDVNGAPDADPAVVAQLKAGVDYLQNAWDSGNKLENKQAADATTATTTARVAAENTPQAVSAAATKAAAVKTAEVNAGNQAAAGAPWVPKVTADEKKKAELAENMAENANAINNILARRPDLVGKLAGRITQGIQYTGTNDADLSALEARVQNFGKANAGVHSLRSYEGVKDTEKAILNSYKNGPDAIKGALNATVDSAQTFIDNARPSTYATHTSQGGAASYYQKQNAPQQPSNPYGAVPRR